MSLLATDMTLLATDPEERHSPELIFIQCIGIDFKYLLLFLLLVTIVRGQTTPKESCPASDEAIKVSVEYDLSSAFGMAWEPPAGSEKCVRNYTVCVTVDGGGSSAACQNTSATSWSTRSVQPCSHYSVAVEALGEGGQQLARGAAAFFSPPSEVVNYTVTNRTSTSLLMTWVVPTNNTCVQKYVLSWRNTTAEHDEASKNLTTTDTSFEVTGLKPCTMYAVSIAGVTADAVETSQGLSIYTAAQGTPLGVSDVSVALASISSISVQWKETSSCIDWYSVCVSAVGTTDKNCSQVTDGDLQWTSGVIVKPCTDYNVTVSAVDYAGQYSEEEVQVFTGAPGEAEDLKVSGRTANTMSVAWNAPAGDGAKCLKSYELYVCARDDPATCGTLVDTPASSDKSFDVASLAVCEDYDIVMKSVGTTGQRSYGAAIVSYTDVADVNSAIASYGTGMDFTLDSAVDDLVLEASWDLPDNHDCLAGYRVCYSDDSGKSKPVCNDQGVTDVTWSTSDAQYCSKYTITTSAITTGGESYPQASGDVITPPFEVQNLTVKGATADKIHVTWTHPPASRSSCLQEYAVHWCPSSVVGCNTENETAPGATVASNVSEYVLGGLDSCATYLVWVTGLGSDDTESEANFLYAKSGGMVPGNVSKLSDPSVTCGSMYVEWAAPSEREECVAHYQVCWQGTWNGNKSCKSVSYLDTQYDITRLHPSTAYTVTVAAKEAGGETSAAATIYATTLATMPVEELSLSRRTQRSISVSWKIPTENAKCATAMCVAWCYKNPQTPCPSSCEPTVNNSASIPPDSTEFNITDLLPCSNYTITVSVASAGNVLSSGNTIRIHTLYEKPVSVGKLQERTDGSAVTVSWESPTQTQECMAGYQVCWESPTQTQECMAGYQVCWEQQIKASQTWCARTNTESFTLDALPACGVYLASVRTTTTDGSMSAAASVSLDLATPSEVSNLTVATHSSDALAVRWLPPLKNSECVKNYTVCLTVSSGGNATCETISSKETEHSITGLQPKTRYNITLTALGPEGKQSASSSIQAVTDASGASTGSSLGSLCHCSNIAACIMVILLQQYMHFSDWV